MSRRAAGREAGHWVYRSGVGRMCPRCQQPVAACRCTASPRAPRGDGIIRVRRETKGRGGKTVTTATGFAFASDQLRALAGELKRKCGSGGGVKEGTIEIQGDHRDQLVAELEARGFRVKRAGG